MNRPIQTSGEVAQFVILDVGIPNQAKISEAVLNAVSNILCLSQIENIPAVGLALVNAAYESVVKLSSTQTLEKLKKILGTINTVIGIKKCRTRISPEEFLDSIHLGIKTAIEDFENLPNQLDEREACPGKLQITIFSMKKLSELFNHIQMALPNLKTRHLYKIRVIELLEDFLDQDCLRKDQKPFLEYLQVIGSVRKLDEVLKQWLSCGDVNHHVSLVLPDLTVWCDARDCMIRPSRSDQEKGSNEEINEVEDVVLEVISRVPNEGVCEAQIFGNPVMLMPCQWQSHVQSGEYDRLAINSQYFLDLCQGLEAREEYLIAKYKNTNQPLRFMVLMPGAGVMLAKELVSAEMSLPLPDMLPDKRLGRCVPAEVNSRVVTSLTSLSAVPAYDPYDFSSSLYKHLSEKIQRSMEMRPEPLCKDPSHENITFGIMEMKKKIKLKRSGRRSRSMRCELPPLTESDQQTLDMCFSKHDTSSK